MPGGFFFLLLYYVDGKVWNKMGFLLIENIAWQGVFG